MVKLCNFLFNIIKEFVPKDIMENLPQCFITRLNGTDFTNRKEEKMVIEYGTLSTFEDFKKLA